MITTQMLYTPYERRPIKSIEGATASWAIYVDDTQIGKRLEHRADGKWRLVFAGDRWIEMDRERDMELVIRGVLIGRTVC